MTYGPEAFAQDTNVSRETLDRLIAYAALLEKWQGSINLVSRKSLNDLWRRHMLDSAQILTHIPAGEGPVLDLGSGAGFPVLVLAVLGTPDVHLVESDARKCAFLREAARVVGANVTIHNRRIEELPALQARVVTARALASTCVLLSYATEYLDNSGICLFLKGQAVEDELTTAKKRWIFRETLIPSRSGDTGWLVRLEGITHGRDEA